MSCPGIALLNCWFFQELKRTSDASVGLSVSCHLHYALRTSSKTFVYFCGLSFQDRRSLTRTVCLNHTVAHWALTSRPKWFCQLVPFCCTRCILCASSKNSYGFHVGLWNLQWSLRFGAFPTARTLGLEGFTTNMEAKPVGLVGSTKPSTSDLRFSGGLLSQETSLPNPVVRLARRGEKLKPLSLAEDFWTQQTRSDPFFVAPCSLDCTNFQVPGGKNDKKPFKKNVFLLI